MPEHTSKVSPPALSEKVRQWFDSEGYPLEFRTSRAFRQANFSVHQGYYVKDERDGAREIDVLADVTARFDDARFLRVSQVVECKWSRDKPWVLFTSADSIMAESACIAQSVGSRLGEAVTYCLASDEKLSELDMFKRPVRGGFAGRRAFEKREKDSQDLFYRAIQSVTSNAAAKARDWNRNQPREQKVPSSALVVFPIVVVDGDLFEAYHDPASSEVKLSEISRARLFWRGSTASENPITAVEIVSAKALDDFVHTRMSDLKVFLAAATEAARRIYLAFEHRSFGALDLKPAPRGFLGLPALLTELYQLVQAAKKSPGLAEQS